MSTITALNTQLTIAQELAIASQLNGRLHGVLQSLLSDLDSKSDWKYFNGRLQNECVYLEKYGLAVASIRIGSDGDHAENAKQLSVIRLANKRLRSALRNLSDAIDTYSDPGFFQSWAQAVSLGCENAPLRFVAALQVA